MKDEVQIVPVRKALNGRQNPRMEGFRTGHSGLYGTFWQRRKVSQPQAPQPQVITSLLCAHVIYKPFEHLVELSDTRGRMLSTLYRLLFIYPCLLFTSTIDNSGVTMARWKVCDTPRGNPGSNNIHPSTGRIGSAPQVSQSRSVVNSFDTLQLPAVEHSRTHVGVVNNPYDVGLKENVSATWLPVTAPAVQVVDLCGSKQVLTLYCPPGTHEVRVHAIVLKDHFGSESGLVYTLHAGQYEVSSLKEPVPAGTRLYYEAALNDAQQGMQRFSHIFGFLLVFSLYINPSTSS